MEVRDEFLAGGGQLFHRIPCLNSAQAWIDALGEIVTENLLGWNVRVAPPKALGSTDQKLTQAEQANDSYRQSIGRSNV